MAQAPNTTRVTATIPKEMHEQLMFWSNQKGISVNQYLYEALERAIAWENQDYPLPTIELGRLTQLSEIAESVRKDVHNLLEVANAGFESITSLAKGENYLLDETEEGMV